MNKTCLFPSTPHKVELFGDFFIYYETVSLWSCSKAEELSDLTWGSKVNLSWSIKNLTSEEFPFTMAPSSVDFFTNLEINFVIFWRLGLLEVFLWL